jgi:hypothetical protein
LPAGALAKDGRNGITALYAICFHLPFITSKSPEEVFFIVLSFYAKRKYQRKCAGKDNPTLFVRLLRKALKAPPNRARFAPFPGRPRAAKEPASIQSLYLYHWVSIGLR